MPPEAVKFFETKIRPVLADNCFKCHAVDKKRVGPAWNEVAAKLKGDKDAEAKLYKHLTTGPKVKFDDGHQEDHPVLKVKSPEDTKNLADWILSQRLLGLRRKPERLAAVLERQARRIAQGPAYLRRVAAEMRQRKS